jgi:hypothetical protein
VEARQEQYSRFLAHEPENLLARHPTTEGHPVFYPELLGQPTKARFVRPGPEDDKLPVTEMLHRPDGERTTFPVQKPPREKRDGPFGRRLSWLRDDIDGYVGEDLHLRSIP